MTIKESDNIIRQTKSISALLSENSFDNAKNAKKIFKLSIAY